MMGVASHHGSDDAQATLVLGLGATGGSVARHFARRGLRARFADTRPDADTRDVAAAMPGADIRTGALDQLELDGVEQIVVSPGIPPHEPLLQRAQARGVRLLSDIDLFADAASAPIVAVTGSNGKSTTVSLVAHLCKVAGVDALAGGNLGTPALDLLAQPVPDYYVLELSSFQLHRTDTLDAMCACLLNITPDHLDWHGSFEAYRQAKYRIFRRCEYAVINADEAPPAEAIDERASVLSFTLAHPDARQFGLVSTADGLALAFGDTVLIAANRCGITGRHNLANALAALAIGSAIDLPMSAMTEGLRSFAGLAHRHRRVATRAGVDWIDDSKATNTAAALASAGAVDGPLILLAGGRGKGEDLDAFARALPSSVRACVVFGENRATLAAALTAAGRKVTVVETLVEAVREAAGAAREGDTVLLAPAAASQDQFTDFRARGQAFARAVEALDG